MRIGLVGAAYTSRSSAVADEECINWYPESLESQGAMVRGQAYGGLTAGGIKALYSTPGLLSFVNLSSIPRGLCWTGSRLFVVAGTALIELASDGTQTSRGTVASDGNAASMAFSPTQVFIVSGGHAYCLTLATNALAEVTSQMADTPVQVAYSKTYFIVLNASGKYQMSAILDGTSWPGQQVNEVEFPDTPNAIAVNHDELWVFGPQHIQTFSNTGSAEIFDANAPLIETGNAATFGPCVLDNSVFWVGLDQRGSIIAYRSNGYTPQRISTYAVEVDLSSYSNISSLVTYSYQDAGHLFWVLYIPNASWSWVYDVTEGLWHKRAAWVNGVWKSHWSWNHVYAFGKHLVGDWNSGNIYQMSSAFYDDNGSAIRRYRRSPTVEDEMNWINHAEITLDFETGLGPQPPLTDGNGDPRDPQVMLRWSNDRGKTWSNEYTLNCGQAGEYKTRVIKRRLGRSRYRVYEISATDPIPWTLVGDYLRTA